MINIGVFLGGGIGDMLIYMPVLKQLYAMVQTPFDLLTTHYNSGNDQRLFATAPFVKSFRNGASVTEQDIMDYDLIIQMNHFIMYNERQPQLINQYIPQILPYIELSRERAAGFETSIHFQPNFDRVIADYAVLKGLNRQNFTLHSAGFEYEENSSLNYFNNDHEQAISNWQLDAKQYVTIHDGWDNNQNLLPGMKATKCWPDRHWQSFINAFKIRYPNLKIVQLGHQNSTAFENVNLSLVGKIQIDEAAWLLKHSALHIDTETGLVHMAHAMGTKSICLTGPTNAKYYNYPDNINIVSQNCADCWWVKPNWMAKCVRDLPEPECMASILPETVLHHISAYLG